MMYFREYNQTRFLIVDSNIKIRMLIEEYLKSYGAWFIDLAAEGTEAISKCRSGIFDVILCDYNLGGKNGQQVLEELRVDKLQKQTALFIMMSADTTKEMVLGAIEYQPDAYITKPITRDSLKQRMDNLLRDAEALYDIKYALDCDQTDEALYRCEQKIRKGSKYTSWCQKTQASIFLEQGDYDSAEKIYRTVIEHRPLIWARLGMVRVFMARNLLDQAEQELRDIIEKSPLCLLAYDLLSQVLQQKGDKKQAQKVLFDAVALSPHAIQRHMRLGELALENQDLDIATEAFRNSIEHGEQSVFQNADNYLNFARCLHETSTTLERSQRFARNDEAMHAVHTANRRYGELDNIGFQCNMISARIHQVCDRETEAKQALEGAKQVYLNIATQLPAKLGLEYAQTLFNLGHEDEAELVLGQIAMMNTGDDSVQKKIEALRDEPVPYQDKTKAAELNRMGIQLSESGDLEQAIQIFQDAIAYSPRHPALNLNLAQVLLRKISQQRDVEESIALCQQCLSRIRHISEQHKQYPRYQHIRKKLSEHAPIAG